MSCYSAAKEIMSVCADFLVVDAVQPKPVSTVIS
jgi:hypothetical protein